MSSSSPTITALETAQRVLLEESDALRLLAASLDSEFERLIESILEATSPAQSQAKLLTTGIGKSGLVAQKVAATLTSTGTQAAFLHPMEALHGDIGLINRGDIVIAFSKSGSSEVARFAHHALRLGARVAAVTMSPAGNALGDLADPVLVLPDVEEACPLRLAPMTSTTMMMALGDALAAALLEARGFGPSDFARYHPDGVLGRRLLLRVRDLMRQGSAVPHVAGSTGVFEMISELSSKALGIVCVLDERNALLGVITDGDLRRLIQRRNDIHELTTAEALRYSSRHPGRRLPPITVGPDAMAAHGRELMDTHTISSLVVVDPEDRPIGILRLHDLLHAGI
jgi:arabinose-5-phosphate isomerase